MIKGRQHRIVLKNEPFASGRVLFKVRFWFFGFAGGGGGGGRRWDESLVPGAAGGQSFLLCACLGRMTCGLDLLSLESYSAPP